MSEARVLDEETRRKLAGVVSFSQSAEVRIDPYEGTKLEPELRPLFWVHPYTRAEIIRAAGILRAAISTTTGETDMKALEPLYGLIRTKVCRWEQVYDGDTGEVVAYEPDESGAPTIKSWDRYVSNAIRNRLIAPMNVVSGINDSEKLGLQS
jgi:hypothetical protein